MAYSFQTFSTLEVLGAAKMNQIEVNIRDHIHGQSGVSAVPETPYPRNCVESSALSSGQPLYLSAGTGLALNLAATTTALILTFSNGFDATTALPSDLVSKVTADASSVVSSLPASNTSYITTDYSSSSAVTWGKYLVPPWTDFQFTRSRGSLLAFEGSNGASTTTCDFGNTITLSGATISTAQAKHGSSSLDCTGGSSKYFTSSSFKSVFGNRSWTYEGWFYINALPGAAARATLVNLGNASGFGVALYLFNNAGTHKLEVYLSANGTSDGIANGTVGTNTTWNTGQWHKFRIVFDALGGSYKVYLSLNGAAETTDITVASSTAICAITTVRGGRNVANTNQADMYLDSYRFVLCATNTSTETPSGTPSITDYPYNWYSVNEEVWYEATGASSTAGVNPTMTSKTRVLHAVVTTSGAAVASVTHLQLRNPIQLFERDFTTIGTNSWTKLYPWRRLKHATVHVQAGGGNGSASATASIVGCFPTNGGAGAAAGAGGGYSRKAILAETLGEAETVTVGNTTGTSSFGSHASATGGSSGSASSGINSGAGTDGTGGTGSGGDINVSGNSGSVGGGGGAPRFQTAYGGNPGGDLASVGKGGNANAWAAAAGGAGGGASNGTQGRVTVEEVYY